MIQRLRKKFILINMLLVTLVLLIVFSVLCFSSYRRLQNDSNDAMMRALSREEGMSPPKFEIGQPKPDKPFSSMTPVFTVLVDNEGNVLSISNDTVDVSDELVDEAVEQVLSSGSQEGVLSALSLRYRMAESPNGTKIAFADLSNEKATMTNLLVTSLLVGAGGLLAFFAISVFLSNWALRPVEKAWEQQRQFVADASHELKTPLTVILANTGILLSHPQDTIAQQGKWVEYTQAEASRMKKLVDDLLFLAKSDAAKAPALQLRFNLSDTAWSCLLPFESVAFEQKVLLKSEVTPNLYIVGDESQMKQLIMILLDNACKYTGKGGLIHFCMEPSQDKIKIAVNNTGAPIPAEHLNHLFERFYRADKSRTRDQGGYGLGLAIAQSIVSAHHGKIHAESNEKNGTTFTVYLPAK